MASQEHVGQIVNKFATRWTFLPRASKRERKVALKRPRYYVSPETQISVRCM